MAVILHVFVEVHFHVVAVPAQVVPRQVYQHDVFGVFFRVVFQVVCILCIRTALPVRFVVPAIGSI